MTMVRRALPICLALVLFPAVARAQAVAPPDRPEDVPQAKPEEARPTGLPSAIQWKFNFDAGWGSFGFNNSLFLNPKDTGTTEDLSDQWFEGYVKPALTFTYVGPSSGELYGKISAVGERTYGEVPDLFGHDVSSFGPEDLYIGWKSGKKFSLGDNLVDVSVGRERFRLGHGFLLYDGASEGGERGGYWTNARQAFEFAAVARFQPEHHKVETFYLDKDELPASDSGTRLYGLNYEYSLGKDNSTTLGATYMHFWAHQDLKPGRDGLNVFNIRAYSAPDPKVPDFTVEFEYASERNGEVLNSNAWTAQLAYQASNVYSKPKFIYRYAWFQGDDPASSENESWDPLLLGFYDWGTWWQGEIAGEYFLSNSNLKSHEVRVHLTPTDRLGWGVILFKFNFDHPTAVGPTVLSTDAGTELDSYADWKLNSNFTLSLVGAFAKPGKAIEEFTGRTKNFMYGMAYIAYSF